MKKPAGLVVDLSGRRIIQINGVCFAQLLS